MYAAILARHGPSSLLKSRSLTGFIFGEYSLLEVMRACRNKEATNPKDKGWGTLGLLSEALRNDIRADYDMTVESIYRNMFDLIATNTGRLDVICDPILYPLHAHNASLRSRVPDWSPNPGKKAIGAVDLGSKLTASLSQKANIVLDGNMRETSRVEIDIRMWRVCSLRYWIFDQGRESKSMCEPGKSGWRVLTTRWKIGRTRTNRTGSLNEGHCIIECYL